MEVDDDVRWLLAIISDNGMRLAKAAGLIVSDIKLDTDIPLDMPRKHTWQTLKTKGCGREIPLVRMSLWAV